MNEGPIKLEGKKPDAEMQPLLNLLGKIDNIANQSTSFLVKHRSEFEKGKIYYRPLADNERGIMNFYIKTDKESSLDNDHIDFSQIKEVVISYDFPGEADSTDYQIIILTRNNDGSWAKRAATLSPDSKKSPIDFPPERIIPRTQYLLETYLQSLKARVSNR